MPSDWRFCNLFNYLFAHKNRQNLTDSHIEPHVIFKKFFEFQKELLVIICFVLNSVSDCFPPGTTDHCGIPAAGSSAGLPDQRCEP